ncbi:MAG: GyrI-like domain-containing protein [Anaerolineae bacterium]|nr:GyrI-like domain-containing protein [Anaerolineae bacterium]
MVQKLDFKKTEKYLYQPPAGRFEIIEVPPLPFLMVDGAGSPNEEGPFHEALQALYGVSYTLKFTSKKEPGIDYTVLPLEALWYVPGKAIFELVDEDPSAWQWTAMIRQPEHISPEMVEQAIASVRARHPSAALDRLRLERFHEGLSVQTMHIGPYSAEAPTINAMHVFMKEQGLDPAGKHHEIYLGDPRTSAPEKLRTVLRQPARRALCG